MSTSRVSPGRSSISVIPNKEKQNSKTPDVALKNLLFLLTYSSSEVSEFFLTSKTRRRPKAPAALTLANVILKDDRVQSANSVSSHLITSGETLA